MIFLSDENVSAIDQDAAFLENFRRYARRRISRITDQPSNYILPEGGFPSPWRYDWERRSNAIYGTLMVIAQLRDIGRLDPKCAAMARSSERWVRDMRDHIVSAPYWRPSGANPSEPWDFNGWSNGLLPGALGLCCAILDDTPSSAIEAFIMRGASWLVDASFPEAHYWHRRSTNHGIVIYSSFLLGAELLRLNNMDFVRRLDADWHAIMADTAADGSYSEGLHYLVFAFDHALPLIWLKAQQPGWSLRHYPDGMNYFRLLPDYLNHATSATGVPFANFGDEFLESWENSGVSRMTSALAGRPLAHHVPTGPFPLSYHAPIDYCLSTSIASPIDGYRSTLFDKRRMAAVDYYRNGKKTSGLFVFGSKRHLTHSRNHDCCGFVLEIDGRPLVTARKGRSPLTGNAALAFNGDQFVDYTEPRDYDGDVHMSGTEIFATSSYNRDFRRVTGIQRCERRFTPDFEESRITIETSVEASKRAAIAFNFVPAGDFRISTRNKNGAELDPVVIDGTTCFVCPQEGNSRFLTTIEKEAVAGSR
ncbi:hypothetical protein [Bosea sp. NPDC055594]